MTEPDPSSSITKDDIEIPLGKGHKTPGLKSTLLYNEYPFALVLYLINNCICSILFSLTYILDTSFMTLHKSTLNIY